MTLQELIKAIRTILREPTPARWADSDIKRYINTGLREIALSADYYHTTEKEYELGGIKLPPDMLKVHAVYWDNRELLISLDMIVEQDEGVPNKYCILDDKIKISPTPEDDGQVRIVYIKEPEKLMDDNDTPELAHADNVIIAYGVWQAFLEDGSPYTQIWEMEYAKRLTAWSAMHDTQTAFMVKGGW